MKKRELTTSIGKKELVFCVFAALVFFLFITQSDIAIDYMKRSLKLCFIALIPSIFPFTVISELIVKSGVGYLASGVISRPAGRLLGVGRESVCALVLGAVCGFPIGAKTLCSAYDEGAISKEEAEMAMTFCNTPGSAFVINTVGISLLQSRRLGIMLYVCCLLSALSVGAIVRLIFRSNTPKKTPFKIPPCPSPSPVSVFVSAIQSAALSTLHVCAFVTFFSALSGCLGAILSKSGLPRTALALLFGFFEVSGGASEAAMLTRDTAAVLCAAMLSWSGLSVTLQLMAVSFGRGISFKPYFYAKGAQAMLSAALMATAIKIFPLTKDAFGDKSEIGNVNSIDQGAAFVCFAFFLASLAWTFCGIFSTKNGKKIFQKKFRKRG